MEQHGNNSGGGEQHQPRIYPSDEGQQQDTERSELARQVDDAIEAARMNEQSIDDLTAKRISTDIQPGSGALYDLAATGKISGDIYAELDVASEVLPEIADTWLAALEDYCLGQSDRGQVAGWADVAGTAETDEQRIYHGITEALLEARPIDHGTARAIAVHLHGEQATPLCALASTGSLIDGLAAELDVQRAKAPVEVEPWFDALAEYIDNRADPGSVEGWQQLWPSDPDREDGEPATGEEERPPYGSTEDLGRVASDAVVEQPRDKQGYIPPLDTYPDCDGYAWIERLPTGWKAVPSWGRGGWDLARWPRSIVATYENPDTETYAVGIYTEGDITILRQPSQEWLYEAIDDLAEWYWRNGVALGPEDLPKVQGRLPHHEGPFSGERLRRWEREQGRTS